MGRWVNAQSLDSLGFALGSLGLSGVFGFTRISRRGRWLHPVLLGTLVVALEVAGSIRGHWVNLSSPWGSMGSSRIVEFTQVRPGRRWVHPVLLGSLGLAIGFIRSR